MTRGPVPMVSARGAEENATRKRGGQLPDDTPSGGEVCIRNGYLAL
jgi:hypothetical protein